MYLERLNQVISRQQMQFQFKQAAERLKGVAVRTPLMLNRNLSERFGCNVYLKREDLQIVRSYKIRGAYNMISSLTDAQLKKGVVCASAGNHAQGVAFSCKKLQVKGIIFMPVITPNQKINQTKMFGGEFVEIRLVGDNFDDTAKAAIKFSNENGMVFMPPFDSEKIIEGQGTVGLEILEDLKQVDFLLMPVGGGGLSAGVATVFNELSPDTQLLGIEAEGAPSLYQSLKLGKQVTLEKIDSFTDGIAVKRIGDINFPILQKLLKEVKLVPEGKICSTILKLYNEEAIVVEPAGAVCIAALDSIAAEIKGKNVVCIVSGSNNDIDRMNEIKERALQYEGLKHYFLVRFAQRPGALKQFVSEVLGPNDDITRFEYMQKNNKEQGPALVGIELKQRDDYSSLMERMEKFQVNYTELRKDDKLFEYMV